MAKGLTGNAVRDFSGGPDIRDAASQLAPNECLDAWNLVFDERGGTASRLGYVKLGTLTPSTLTVTGSPTFNGDGSVTIDSTGADRISAPASLVGPEGWFAARVRIGADISLGATNFTIARQTGGTSAPILYFAPNSGSPLLTMQRGGPVAAVAAALAPGATATVIGTFDATTVKVSLNGAPFTAVANTNVATGATSVEIGTNGAGGAYLNGDEFWCLTGTGTLTDADAATINAFGNSDPSPATIAAVLPAANCTAVMPFTSSAYTAIGLPYGGGPVRNEFWSQILGALIVQAGPSLYEGTSVTAVKTFTTSELVTFCEMNSLIVACHPTDGLFTSPDGVTWTAVADPDAPKGTCVAVWQNKVFVGCPDGSARWSNATTATAWTATDFNKLWEKDQQALVAIHVGSGQDILGQPGLLCFKQESTYRISDSATGAYTTVDGTVGAAGALAVVGVGSKVLTISKHGISWWREDQAGMVNASSQFLPLWDPAQLNLSELSLWCAGREGTRAVFSCTRLGSTANDLSIRYSPDQNWLAPGSDAMSCYATSTGAGEILYGGSPTVSGQAYQLHSGGTDDGAGIDWRLQTRWIELSSDFLASVWQIRFQGRGSGDLTVRKDYASSGGSTAPFDFGQTGPHWDTGLHWDTGVIRAVPVYQSTIARYSIGTCRELSLLFEGTATTTVDGSQVLGFGGAPQVGEFALYGITWLYAALGLA